MRQDNGKCMKLGLSREDALCQLKWIVGLNKSRDESGHPQLLVIFLYH